MAGEAIRAAFREQAEWCVRLGSPFTARLCTTLADLLDPSEPIGRRVLDWPGDPAADALALRLCGGLHALVRSGGEPALAAFYPPAAPSEADGFAEILRRTLIAHGDWLDGWLDSPPQTNEVGRSAALYAGLLALADAHPHVIDLFELGASAGLNLNLDRFRYRLGGREAGDPAARLRLAPEWKGGPPPAGRITLRRRRGVDLRPADPIADRERLLAYVWPDHTHRLAQLEAALTVAASHPPPVDQGDAADWLEAQLGFAPVPGVTRVVMHSVAFQYFPEAVAGRVRDRIEAAGEKACGEAPVAWLRFEKLPEDEEFSLRLRTWPGEDRLLAWVQAHGAWVHRLER